MVGINITVDLEDIGTPEIDEDAIEAWVEARLNAARNIFIRNVSRGGGGGRTYRRGSRTHQASAPGEYPATDSGRLANSIDYEMHSKTEGSIFSNLQYAEFLKRGTVHMAPRKMLHEALQEAIAEGPPLQGIRWR